MAAGSGSAQKYIDKKIIENLKLKVVKWLLRFHWIGYVCGK